MRYFKISIFGLILLGFGIVSAQRSSNMIFHEDFNTRTGWYEQNEDGVAMRVSRDVYAITMQESSASPSAWVWNSINLLRVNVRNGPVEIEYVIRRVWATSDSYCVILYYDVRDNGNHVRTFTICDRANWALSDSAQTANIADGALSEPIDFSAPHTVALQFRNGMLTALIDGQQVAEIAAESPIGDLGFGVSRGDSKPFVQLEVESLNAHYIADSVLPEPAGEIGDNRDYSFLPLDQYDTLGLKPYVADTDDFAFLYPPKWFIGKHENGAIVLSNTMRSLREALIAPDYPTALRDSAMYIWRLSAEEVSQLAGANANAGEVAQAFVAQNLPSDLHGGNEPAQPVLQQRGWYGYYVERSRPMDVFVRGLTLEDGGVGVAITFDNGDTDIEHGFNELPVIESFSASDRPFLLPSQLEDLGIADGLSNAPSVEINVDLSANYVSPFAGYTFNYPDDGSWQVGVAGTDSNALSIFSGGLIDMVFPMVTATHNQSEQIQIFIPATTNAAGALTQVAGYFAMQSIMTTSLENGATSYARVNDRGLSITEGVALSGDPVVMVTTILDDDRMATLLTFDPVDRDTLLGIAASISAIEGIRNDTVNISPYIEFGDEIVYGYTGRWYFDAFQGDIVKIEMISEEFNTLVQLFDPAGNLVAQNDDVSDEDVNSSIPGVMLPLTGTYTIVSLNSRDNLDRAPGLYRLSLQQADEIVEDDVPTQTFNGQERVIAFEGEGFIGYESFCERLEVGESHLWTFEAQQGDKISVSSYGVGISNRLHDDIIELYDSAGNLLGESDSRPIRFDAPATATYTVLLYALNDIQGGAYCIDIKYRPF